ncbi:MAG: serine/threonine protein kinase [Flavobacteriales bacterium]|nr:MAG: serine/threonine protein kinase [Flavobacteriales bacterium]
MDAERWQRLSPLLDALIDLDADARAERLAALRAEDPALAAELEALLALEDAHGDFLSEPLVTPPPMAKPDTLIGPYKLDRLLGEGGMGQVWLARRADGLYQRRVALKLLRPGLADPNLRQRFTRERQILARLGHPHIARLLDAGISSDNQPYLALEYVEGEPITDWCRSHDLGIDARLKLFLQVCEAVSHAHANLIVHRDLKPSNILVTPLDEVRLLDFGIAKLLDSPEPGRDNTRTEVRAFTLHYAAPEQIRGEPVTTMTDVYSLGVVLYELLAETKPYRLKRQTDAEWEEAILISDPLKPSATLLREADSDPSRTPALRRRAREISGDLDNIVLKALSKRPEHRYPSVEAMSLDLHRYLEGKPVLARPQSMAYRSRKFVQRHRWALAMTALIVGVLTSALVLVTWQARQALREAARAQALQDFVTGLFEQAGGNTNPGEPLDVRKLLEDGEQRGNRELAKQPLTRAELLGVIARLRIGLGDYREAEQLLTAQHRIISGLDKVPESLRLSSASDYGRTLFLLDRSHECIAQMQPLEGEARRLQRQLPAQVAEFYSNLGRCLRVERKSDKARRLFQRSLEVRRNTLDDIAGVVENLADLAGLESDKGNAQAALRGYRNALAQLEASMGNRHPLAIGLQRSVCALERHAGRLAIAERDCHDALTLALEVRGPEHPDSIDASRQLAAIHVDQGRFREAEIAFRNSRRWLVARVGTRHEDVARDDNSLGVIAWERGDISGALKSLDRALTALHKSPNTLYTSGVMFNKAMILHEAGRDGEALSLLLRVRRMRESILPKNHPQFGDTARMIGEVQAALGRDAAARESLVTAVRLTRAAKGYGPSHPGTRRAELSLARFDLLRGDPPAPSILVQLEQLTGLPKTDSELRKVAWLAATTLAAHRCAETGAEEPIVTAAREQLETLAADIAQAMPEGGQTTREFERLRAGCR